MTYHTTTSKSIKITTLIILLIIFGVSTYTLLYNQMPLYIKISIILFLFILTIFCWAFAPVSYTIGDYDFRVNRNTGNKLIRLSKIKKVYLLSEDEKKGMIRLWGVGMFFGTYGKFRSSALGMFNMYATNSKNLVCIIKDDDSKIVISPDNLEIITELQKEIN